MPKGFLLEFPMLGIWNQKKDTQVGTLWEFLDVEHTNAPKGFPLGWLSLVVCGEHSKPKKSPFGNALVLSAQVGGCSA